MKLVLAITLATLLTACVSTEAPQSVSASGAQVASQVTEASFADRLRTRFSGNTMHSFSPHGMQIEYHAPDGATYLWYPGNTGVVVGRWRVRTRGRRLDVCYRYSSNSYNPITRQRGGSWECSPVHSQTLTNWVQGDPFDLESGEIPFRITDRRQHSLRRLMTQAGRNPSALRPLPELREK